MKSILKRNRILAVIALIGLLASLVPLISRVQAEKSNKYYDIVLDYNSMRSMAPILAVRGRVARSLQVARRRQGRAQRGERPQPAR